MPEQSSDHHAAVLENCRNWHLDRVEEREAKQEWTEAKRHRRIAASLDREIAALRQLGSE